MVQHEACGTLHATDAEMQILTFSWQHEHYEVVCIYLGAAMPIQTETGNE